MLLLRRRRALVACALAAWLPHTAARPPRLLPPGADRPRSGGTFQDPLHTAAPNTRLTSSTALFAVSHAGSRLVATGVRGLVIVSDDQGGRWRQVPVPVSSDLVALHFPTAALGWIVGHDGVVLHTSDAGSSWHKQLDGRRTEAVLRAHYEALMARNRPEGPAGLRQLALDYAHGPEQPLLDVRFESPQRGFATGAFGLLLSTEDGGASWTPRMSHIDNPLGLHLNAVRRIGTSWFIASERGIVFRFDDSSGRFDALPTGYSGSFFGLLGSGAEALAHGLRGNAYRTVDAGDRWVRTETGLASSAIASTTLPDGRWLLASPHGQLSLSADHGASFRAAPLRQPRPVAGVVAAAGGLIVVGRTGVQKLPLP